jgi:hypothetical protein
MHEGHFLNVSFFAKQFFGILGLHIETEWVFNLIKVLSLATKL